MPSLLKRLGSIRLAIVLFILLVLTSALGTLIPQEAPPEVYRARYGAGAALVTGLRFDRLYGSPAYLTLLLLFGANLAACGLTRFLSRSKRARAADPGREAADLAGAPGREGLVRRGTVETAASTLRRALRERGYRVREAPGPGRHALLARRRALGLFGPDVVHLGLLVVLAGGIVSGLARSSADVALFEGETVPLRGGSQSLRLDRFETEYHPSGRVKDWKSTVSVLEDGASLLTRVIEVNHPMRWRGTRYYQSGYGRDWERASVVLRVRRPGDAAYPKDVALAPGQSAELDEGTSLSVLRFVPDLVIGEGGAVSSRSMEPNNPAVLVEGRRPGREAFSGWVFARYPEFSSFRPEDATDLAFELRSYEAPAFTVLQATRDPGAGLVWLGSALLLSGLFLSFYWTPREVGVLIEARKDSTVAVAVGGRAPKGREGFERELAALRTELGRMMP